MHPDRADPKEATVSEPRSWLFVPADSERKIAKALDSDADAIIFDLEDSVAPGQKTAARDILKNLPQRTERPQLWVRINPIGSEFHRDDLHLIGVADIHGIVLPKAEGGWDVIELAHRTGNIPIHAIVTETAASLFGMLSYRDPKSPLAAMSWGAEDLSATGSGREHDRHLRREVFEPLDHERGYVPATHRLHHEPSVTCLLYPGEEPPIVA